MPTPTTAWSPTNATRQLRDAARTFEVEAEMFAAQALADYLESTAVPDSMRLRDVRNLFAEIAMAYVAGFEQGTKGTRARQLHRALRDTGMLVQ